jgi:hypothetical protein
MNERNQTEDCFVNFSGNLFTLFTLSQSAAPYHYSTPAGVVASSGIETPRMITLAA